jgi:hypothetical protein
MSNQGLSQVVQPSQVPEVGGLGGREVAAARAAVHDSSAATPGPRSLSSDLLSSSVPDPVHKLFPDEQKAAPLVEDFPTGTLGESQEKEDILSRSVTVSKPDGMGAVVLRTDWIVETLDGGTRLSYLNERRVPHLPDFADSLRCVHYLQKRRPFEGRYWAASAKGWRSSGVEHHLFLWCVSTPFTTHNIPSHMRYCKYPLCTPSAILCRHLYILLYASLLFCTNASPFNSLYSNVYY